MALHPAGEAYKEHAEHGFDSFVICRLPQGFIHHSYILGLSASGPYHQPHKHSKRAPLERLESAREDFLSVWGKDPDIIVFSCNFWEVHRMKFNTFFITNRDVLRTWRQEFSGFIHAVETAFPATRLRIYHTSAFTTIPAISQPIVHDLNNAASSILTASQWRILDLESLTNSFINRREFLRDAHHRAPFVMKTVFDMYLSLLVNMENGQSAAPTKEK